MKNNPFDGLNYEKPNYSPVQDFAKWYEENAKSKPNENKSEVDRLREQFNRDPESLSPIQRLTLGFAELSKKNEEQSLQRQAKAHDEMNQHNEQQEMISVQSKEFQTLADNMAALQAEFQRMNGGDE